ncbi:MAG: hypothetical protein FJZ01_17290, partial [Candidatus Sericytochromatia bacterium]|nr:hypothetical protein [Candidatus Tanganyikabacteria bacterium]
PASRAKPPAGAATGPASRPVPVARAAATAPAGAAKQGKGSAPPGRSAASAGTRTISPITAARGLQRVVIHHRRPGAVVLTLDGSRVDVEFTELGPGPARPTHKESK